MASLNGFGGRTLGSRVAVRPHRSNGATPRAAAMRAPHAGKSTTPSPGTPRSTRPSIMPHDGSPRENARVPSIGSTVQ